VTEIPAEVRHLAEDPYTNFAPPPGWERVDRDGYVLNLGPPPTASAAVRIRLEPQGVEPAVEDARTLVSARGYDRTLWFVGESSRPKDLLARLEAAGAVPPDARDHEPRVTAMALVERPAGSPKVEVRPVSSREELLEASLIVQDVFDLSQDRRDAFAASLDAHFADEQAGRVRTFVAWIDGRPAAAAAAVFSDRGALLVGGSTLSWARGRGAYRSLVHARWDEAIRRGAPALVTHAGEHSRPILERLGFVPVCEVDVRTIAAELP
jgi:hypothetical protein